jgi:hypothetical protein
MSESMAYQKWAQKLGKKTLVKAVRAPHILAVGERTSSGHTSSPEEQFSSWEYKLVSKNNSHKNQRVLSRGCLSEVSRMWSEPEWRRGWILETLIILHLTGIT